MTQIPAGATRGLWWIDTYTFKRGDYYRYAIVGRNDMRGGEPIYWRLPSLDNNAYAFALRQVSA